MLTVKQIQHALYTEFRGRGWKYFSTNTKAYKYEADLIGITSSRIVTEFEIKRSRGDYFSEIVNKKEKHYYLQKGKLIPNYFYFVCEYDLLKEEEVPSYCGLIYVKKNEKPGFPATYNVKVVRPAPKLHPRKVTDYNIILVLRSLMFKYFENLN